jgi:beta-lactamase regulating signal transducer with metallopeptidase domain
MPLMTRALVVSLPNEAPPARLVRMIEQAPSVLLEFDTAPSEIAPPVAAPRPAPGGDIVVAASVPPAAAVRHAAWSSAFDWVAIATALYLAVAGVLLLRLLLGVLLTWRVARAARPLDGRWATGRNIRVSDIVGVPVTFGTTILLPPQCTEWSAEKREAVLLHERAHVAHGDFYVLLLATVNRALFWFSPFAWWQLRRLAVLAEMISDDAAIAVLADRPCYADILLDLAGNVAKAPAAIAMARAGTVRQRVERILAASGLPVRIGWRTQALIATALVPLVAVCAVTIAHGTLPASEVASGEADPNGLEALTGWYQLNPLHTLAITRAGGRLFAQETGGAKIELLAQEEPRFASADGNAVVTFNKDESGRAGELTVQEPVLGARRAQRVDAARAHEIGSLFERRIALAPDRFRNQTPAPGSKAAVLRVIAEVRHGTPDYTRMGPPLAERMRAQLPALSSAAVALGAVQAAYFRGVGPGGYDIYGVKFANGSAELRILMGADGTTEDMLFRPDGDDSPGAIVGCANEQSVKAATGTAPIKLLLFNTSGAELELFGLDQDGNRAGRIPLADNRTAAINTAIGRPWVVADAEGNCREIVLPGQRTRFIIVHPAQAGVQPDLPATRRTAPLPNGEEALRQYIESVARGTPDYAAMAPEVAAYTRRELALNQAILTKLGPVRAMSFRGVTGFNADLYMVHFESGTAEWRIGLMPDGKIGRLALGPQF